MKRLKIRMRSLLAIFVAVAIVIINYLDLPIVYAQSPAVALLSPADTSAVLAWIANETAAEKTPYCYRQSYGRGVGTIPTEAEGNRVKIGALSYSQCPANTRRVGVDCHSVCPDGLRDDGLFCRAAEYGRGAGYTLFARGKCERENSQGCERCLALLYPRCRDGFSPVGCNICRPSRPNCSALGLAGGVDLSCAKRVIVGDARPLTCAAGRENDAGLCYANCRDGYNGIGPVCYQNCNPGTFSCGAGCTTDRSTCINNTLSQVIAPATLAVNIITFGTASAATGAATTTATSSKVASTFNNVREKFQPLIPLLSQANTIRSVASNQIAAFNTAIDSFTDAYQENIQALTTANVVGTLRQRLTPAQFNWIVKKYAMAQLEVALGNFKLDALRGLTPLDPTGISGVVSAYARPVCTKNQPFPTITVANPR